jgi:hypothetical protein
MFSKLEKGGGVFAQKDDLGYFGRWHNSPEPIGESKNVSYDNQSLLLQ